MARRRVAECSELAGMCGAVRATHCCTRECGERRLTEQHRDRHPSCERRKHERHECWIVR